MFSTTSLTIYGHTNLFIVGDDFYNFTIYFRSAVLSLYFNLQLHNSMCHNYELVVSMD